MALTESQPALSREQVLAAKRTGESEWVVSTDTATMKMVPYVGVGDAVYSAYLKLG
jgi:hypothetical protein